MEVLVGAGSCSIPRTMVEIHDPNLKHIEIGYFARTSPLYGCNVYEIGVYSCPDWVLGRCSYSL
jgi:hypothetical protein